MMRSAALMKLVKLMQCARCCVTCCPGLVPLLPRCCACAQLLSPRDTALLTPDCPPYGPAAPCTAACTASASASLQLVGAAVQRLRQRPCLAGRQPQQPAQRVTAAAS